MHSLRAFYDVPSSNEDHWSMQPLWSLLVVARCSTNEDNPSKVIPADCRWLLAIAIARNFLLSNVVSVQRHVTSYLELEVRRGTGVIILSRRSHARLSPPIGCPACDVTQLVGLYSELSRVSVDRWLDVEHSADWTWFEHLVTYYGWWKYGIVVISVQYLDRYLTINNIISLHELSSVRGLYQRLHRDAYMFWSGQDFYGFLRKAVHFIISIFWVFISLLAPRIRGPCATLYYIPKHIPKLFFCS